MKRASAGKLLIETLQVARHVAQLGLRPLEKVARQVGGASEELAVWAIKSNTVEKAIGRRGTKQLLDAYMQAKEVASESVNSLSHQSRMSALQGAAQAATSLLQATGAQTRVVGPFDEHWNALKVIGNLRTVARERSCSAAFQLTPRRFVLFMREAEKRKRRQRQRDPIEDYIEWMFSSGSLNRMGPMFFEKKIYMDVARIICFAFDQALMEADGTDFLGHRLRVKVAKEGGETEVRPRVPSKVGVDQIEALMDRLLKNSDLKAPMFMSTIQRQLLNNCAVVILQLVEDLTSDRQMQVTLLGHALRIQLDPIPMEQLLQQESKEQLVKCQVNEQAVEELVDALLEESEVQFVLVPDLLEAEAYRYVIRMVIRIAHFIFSRLRIFLFGLEVRLQLEAEQVEKGESEEAEDVHQLIVSQEDLQVLIDRLNVEQLSIQRELQLRQGELEGSSVHPFVEMAAMDQLSRSFSVQFNVAVPLEAAFQAIAEIEEYPNWMPLCTYLNILPREPGHIYCDMGFGIDTRTFLGTIQETIRYRVSLERPSSQEHRSPRAARVVLDTVDGFPQGKRLVYDWKFTENPDGETDVRLNVFFQAKSVFYLPLWDSMQNVLSSAVLRRFRERSTSLARQHWPSAPAVAPDC